MAGPTGRWEGSAGPRTAHPADGRISVLFIGDTFVVGGAERIIAHLSLGLRRFPFRCELLALRAPGPIGEELRSQRIPVHSGLTGLGRFDPLLLFRLHAFLRRGGYEVVYFLDHAHAVFYGTLAALGTKARVRVMPVHTFGQWGGRPSLRRPIRIVRRWLDRIIAIAQTQGEYLVEEEGLPRGQLEVIYNGIPAESPDENLRRQRRAEARALVGAPIGAPVVGITAVLRPEKNHELLLRAFVRVRGEIPEAQLWVVGDGPRREFLEAEARRLGLGVDAGPTTAVRFLGHRGDARRILAGFDLAALVSHLRGGETLPLSLLEAMDAGLPVVATRVGALHEMIEEGRSGLLVPPQGEEELALALTRLLKDPELRESMGRRGQEMVRERFTVEGMVDATARLLQELHRTKARGG